MAPSTSVGRTHAAPDRLQEYELDGELTIFDPRSSQAVFLNRTATACWRMLDGSLSETSIVEGLATAFAADSAQVAHDISTLLDHLCKLGLLEQRDPPQRRP